MKTLKKPFVLKTSYSVIFLQQAQPPAQPILNVPSSQPQIQPILNVPSSQPQIQPVLNVPAAVKAPPATSNPVTLPGQQAIFVGAGNLR